MIPAAISLRYARALVGLADEAGRLETVADGLSQLSALCEQHNDLRLLIRHPSFSIAQRSAILNDLMSRLNLDALLRPFVGLVVEKGRLLALSAISESVQFLTDEKLGRMRAQATSAVVLTAAQLAVVTAALEKRAGCRILLETSVDASLIAGLQVQLGHELLDGTVKGRLDRLGQQLLAK
jgi:F-type H+-transporting ATPase subunit delta